MHRLRRPRPRLRHLRQALQLCPWRLPLPRPPQRRRGRMRLHSTTMKPQKTTSLALPKAIRSSTLSLRATSGGVGPRRRRA